MSCPRHHDAASYVLGALPPTERLDFERHLDGCGECSLSVRELAGIPALLGKVDADVLEDLDHPVPATLLPTLARSVRRVRRRRTLAAAAVALVLGAGGAGVSAAVLAGADEAPPAAPQAGAGEEQDVETVAMQPAEDAPVRASLSLEDVTWGTRLGLTCTYDPTLSPFPLPKAVDYVVFVQTRGGDWEQVGSWRSLEGRTMHIEAATATHRDQIDAVEVRTPGGRVVLSVPA